MNGKSCKYCLSILLLTAFLCSFLTAPVSATAFSDVPESHWAYASIMEAANDGAIQGYSNGTFGPTASLTLAHFTTILSRSFYADELANVKTGESAPWYAAAEAVGNAHDLFWAVNAGMTEPLSRYDMAAVLYNLMADQIQDWSVSKELLRTSADSISDFKKYPADCRNTLYPISTRWRF